VYLAKKHQYQFQSLLRLDWDRSHALVRILIILAFNVPDEGYSRNALTLFVLNLMSTVVLHL